MHILTTRGQINTRKSEKSRFQRKDAVDKQYHIYVRKQYWEYGYQERDCQTEMFSQYMIF